MKLRTLLHDMGYKPHPIENIDEWLKKRKNSPNVIFNAGKNNLPNFDKEKAFVFLIKNGKIRLYLLKQVVGWWNLDKNFLIKHIDIIFDALVEQILEYITNESTYSKKINPLYKFLGDQLKKLGPIEIKKRYGKNNRQIDYLLPIVFPIKYSKEKIKELRDTSTKLPKKGFKL